jgi:hypothetical protein
MKDLLVYTADADALALMRALLARPVALQIRAITFDIERHPQRDAGMVQSGPELARIKKGRYHKALLIWDHHGSGRDHKQTPSEVEKDMQDRLDSVTWRDNSTVAVLVPELEHWLWFSESAIAKHCGVALAQLNSWAEERAGKLGRPAAELKAEQPKELFEHIMRDRLKRTISPRDFEEIGTAISIRRLLVCDSFLSLLKTLRGWFPP